MNTEKSRIFAVVGPTASGKSSLAVELCKALSGELLSCDSMQVYQEMDVGTAKPTKEEQKEVRHHLIDLVPPESNYSCGQYVTDAEAVLQELKSRSVYPIFCGGTGLYLDCFLRGSMEEAGSDEVRTALKLEAEAEGNAAMYRKLEKVDPESAAATHENNLKRVLRALEIYRVTGMTKTEFDRKNREQGSPYLPTVLGLCYEDRDLLYRRIDERVDEMMKQGLLEETEALVKKGVFQTNRTAAQAIGYKELFGALNGTESTESAVEKLKLATRHYAKRQMTWFRAKEYVHWIRMDEGGKLRKKDEVLKEALHLFREGNP